LLLTCKSELNLFVLFMQKFELEWHSVIPVWHLFAFIFLFVNSGQNYIKSLFGARQCSLVIFQSAIKFWFWVVQSH
ncbi:hypothetical protein, partial [Photobacterium halotolerans]|uniref:hypothetical protein n=1 Tax=Photobacterium halotolerans TaxID=265726 RepID=UPI001F2C2C6F